MLLLISHSYIYYDQPPILLKESKEPHPLLDRKLEKLCVHHTSASDRIWSCGMLRFSQEHHTLHSCLPTICGPVSSTHPWQLVSLMVVSLMGTIACLSFLCSLYYISYQLLHLHTYKFPLTFYITLECNLWSPLLEVYLPTLGNHTLSTVSLCLGVHSGRAPPTLSCSALCWCRHRYLSLIGWLP